MRFLLFVILAALPVLDLYWSMRLAHWSGTPLWAMLGASTVIGLSLLSAERATFRARTVAALGATPGMRALLDSGRKVLAAMLFIMPGVISDAVAVLLLLLPINQTWAGSSSSR